MSNASTSERTRRAVNETTSNITVSNIMNDVQLIRTITGIAKDTENNID